MWAVMLLGSGLLVSHCLQGPLYCLLLVEKRASAMCHPSVASSAIRYCVTCLQVLWHCTHITSVQAVASMLQKLGSCDAPWGSRAVLLPLFGCAPRACLFTKKIGTEWTFPISGSGLWLSGLRPLSGRAHCHVVRQGVNAIQHQE